MKQFAKGKVGKQTRDQEEVNEEQGTNVFGNLRAEADQAEGELLDRHDIGLEEMPKQYSRRADTDDQEQGEVVAEQRYIAELR